MRGKDTPTEQRRYDGAPAPPRNAGISVGDARAAAEDARREASCEHCDEDDWQNLTRVPKHFIHNCPKHQQPPGEPITLCEDCAEVFDPEGDHRQGLRDDDRVMVLYECGIARKAEVPEPDTIEVEEQVGVDDDGNPITTTKEIEHPHRREPIPKAPIRCECGADIDEVYD